jgi:cell division protein ZapA (FtsZ GTPase activity inhibitor)
MVQNRTTYSEQHAIQELHLAKLKPLLASQDWKLLPKEEQIAFFRMLMRRITTLCDLGALEAALDLFRLMRSQLNCLGSMHDNPPPFQSELKEIEAQFESQLQYISDDVEIEKNSIFETLLDQLSHRLQLLIDMVRLPNRSFFDRISEVTQIPLPTQPKHLASLEPTLDPLLIKRVSKLRSDLAFEEAFESQEPCDNFYAIGAVQQALISDANNCELWGRLAHSGYFLWKNLERAPYLKLAFIALERHRRIAPLSIELEQLSLQLYIDRYRIYDQTSDLEAIYSHSLALIEADELPGEIAIKVLELLIPLFSQLQEHLDIKPWLSYLLTSVERKEHLHMFTLLFHTLSGLNAVHDEQYHELLSHLEATKKLHVTSPDDPKILLCYFELLMAKSSYFDDVHLQQDALLLLESSYLTEMHGELAFKAADASFTLACQTEEEEYLAAAQSYLNQAIKHSSNLFAYQFLQARIFCKNAELNEDGSLLLEGIRLLEQLILFQYPTPNHTAHPSNDLFLEDEIRGISSSLLYDYAACLVMYSEFSGEVEYCLKTFPIWEELIQAEGESQYLLHQTAISFFRCGDLRREPEDFNKALSYFERAYYLDVENGHLLGDWGNAYLYLAEMLMEEAYKEEEMLHYLNLAEERLLAAFKLGHLPSSYDLGRVYAIQELPSQTHHWMLIAYKEGHLPLLETIKEEIWYEKISHYDMMRDFFDHVD